MKIPEWLSSEAKELAQQLQSRKFMVSNKASPILYSLDDMEPVHPVSKEALEQVKNAGLVVVASFGDELLEAVK